MKTCIQIVLLSLVLIVGCGKEDEIINLDHFAGKSEETITFRSACLTLNTYMQVYAYPMELSPQPTQYRKLSSEQTYLFDGYGAGWSDSLSRCLTTFQLAYTPGIERITGSIKSVFENEEILDQYFESPGQVEKVGESLKFTLTVVENSLHSPAGDYFLEGGQIIITIPEKLSGYVEIGIETNGRYCTQ